MTRRPAMVLSAIGLLLLLGRHLTESNDVPVLRDLQHHGLLTDSYLDEANASIQRLTLGTEFQERWQVNGTHKLGFLNVYLVDMARVADRVPSGLEGFVRNCAYLGEPNIVVCDIGLVTHFWDQYNSLVGFSAPERAHVAALLSWVLGHEIGHAAAGHGEAHFDSTRFFASSSDAPMSHRRELEADALLISVAQRDSALAVELTQLLLPLLNYEIQKQIGFFPEPSVGIHSYAGNPRRVTYSMESTHPEFVVRAARLLRGLATTPSYRDGGMSAMIDNFAKTMRPVDGSHITPP